jgi:chromosome segregation ATPase
MLSTPESNVVFTDDQKKQLEVFETRLSNTQSEVRVAAKALSAINNDTVVAIKEREYQDDLLASITAQIDVARKTFDEVNEQIPVARETLSSLQRDIAEKDGAMNVKQMELKDREDAVTKREKDVSTKIEMLRNQKDYLDNAKYDFEIKVSKLRGVIEEL